MQKRADVKQHLFVPHARDDRHVGLLNHGALQPSADRRPSTGQTATQKVGSSTVAATRRRGQRRLDNLQLHRVLALKLAKFAQHAVV